MLVSVEQKREMKRTVRLIRWVHIEVVLAFIGKRCTIPIDGVGLGLSTLLGHLHQLLPARRRHKFPQQEQQESLEACFSAHQSFSFLSLLRFNPALHFLFTHFGPKIEPYNGIYHCSFYW